MIAVSLPLLTVFVLNCTWKLILDQDIHFLESIILGRAFPWSFWPCTVGYSTSTRFLQRFYVRRSRPPINVRWLPTWNFLIARWKVTRNECRFKTDSSAAKSAVKFQFDLQPSVCNWVFSLYWTISKLKNDACNVLPEGKKTNFFEKKLILNLYENRINIGFYINIELCTYTLFWSIMYLIHENYLLPFIMCSFMNGIFIFSKIFSQNFFV